MKIFVDSDAYIAMYVSEDSNNLKTEKLSKFINNKELETYTSWEVIDEVATKLSFLLGKKVSGKFLSDRISSKENLIFVDRANYKKILKLFNSQTSKNVSLTDCSNMVIARDLGIETFFSFDKHYKKNGFKLLSEFV